MRRILVKNCIKKLYIYAGHSLGKKIMRDAVCHYFPKCLYFNVGKSELFHVSHERLIYLKNLINLDKSDAL